MAKASKLSTDPYHYDFVVATTQRSINATMKRWLFTIDQPAFVVCYIAAGIDGVTATPIDYEELKKRANGTDPFALPAGIDPNTNPDFMNLLAARFMGGFRITLGTPADWAPQDIPDILNFDTGTIQSVRFKMFCSQFDVVQLINTGWEPRSWFSASQSSESPWIFESTVNLSQDEVDATAYSQMPPDVQNAIHNLEAGSFSVQQLYFSMATALMYTEPEISGLPADSTIGMALNQEFISRYMNQAKRGGQPLLGVNVVQNKAEESTLKMTDFQLQINPYLDADGNKIKEPDKIQRGAATLNYLCATGGHHLKPSSQFLWNWVDASNLNDQHGLLSVNRDTFVAWLSPQVNGYFRDNCIQPSVRCTLDDASQPVYSWGKSDGNPTYTIPTEGDIVLKADWESLTNSDQAGWLGAIGKIAMRSSYNATVRFVGTQIIIRQHFVIWAFLEKASSGGEGNVVDRTIQDTYTMGVDAQGTVTWTPQTDTSNDDYDPSVNGFLNFFVNVNAFIDDLASWAQNLATTNLSQPPLNNVNGFVFPGGKVFAFRSVQFSDFQDFTAVIDYLDPTTADVIHYAVERPMKSVSLEIGPQKQSTLARPRRKTPGGLPQPIEVH